MLRNTSSAIPPDERAPPLLACLRRDLTEKEVANAFLVIDKYTGLADKNLSSFTLRLAQPSDMDNIKALHQELFPLSYGESFYNSIFQSDVHCVLVLYIRNQAQRNFATISASPKSFFANVHNVLFGKPSEPCSVGLSIVSNGTHMNDSDTARILTYYIRNTLARKIELPYHSLIDLILPTLSMADIVEARSCMSYLVSLGVQEEFRGKGLARYLVLNAKQYARSHGRKVLYLHCASYNEAAYRMYRSSGFVLVEELPDYYVLYGKSYASYVLAWMDESYRSPFDELVCRFVRTALNTLKKYY